MGNELLVDAATLVTEKGREARWLLEGVIQAGGLVLLAGETSSGKSFLALELALGVVARGSAWGLHCGVMGKNKGVLPHPRRVMQSIRPDRMGYAYPAPCRSAITHWRS